MVFTASDDRRATRRAWLVPLLCTTIGGVGWACQDNPLFGGSGMGDDGTSGDTDGDGGPGDGGPGDAGSGDDGPADGTGPGTGGDDAPGDVDDGNDGTAGTDELDRLDVLESIALRVIVPTTAAFVDDATALQTAVDAHVAAIGADPAQAGDELAAAQDAWRTAMLQWQRLEVMEVGPAAPSVSAPGGENLRDAIYSWPTVDTCTIDRGVAEARYENDDFFVTALIYAYGLDALEYLLFSHGPEHTCPVQVQLDGPWTALGFEEIERRRAAYASVVAAHILDRGQLLAQRWSPEGGDVAGLLANPGVGDSPWTDDVHALDDVFRAMFYVDLVTKDAKIGAALGLDKTCATPPCSQLFESQHGDLDAPAIAANLAALREMVLGGPDPEQAAGFNDLLVLAGHGDVGTTLVNEIDAAIAIAEGFDAPLQQVAATDPEAVQGLYDAVKLVTDQLKGPFVMALMLTVPAEGAGDND
jgi:uncharacterized protein